MTQRENIAVALRMRDAALCLAANPTLKLSRIELQKAVYLSDTLTVLFDLVGPLSGHETYKHGPFDVNLQNAVDSLAFRGLVTISGHHYISVGHQCRYQLTQAGTSWGQSLALAFERLTLAHDLVADNLKRLGWRRVVSLTYAEPMFVNARRAGFGETLQHSAVNGLSSSRFLSIIASALGKTPRAEVVARTFFDFLDKYDQDSSAR